MTHTSLPLHALTLEQALDKMDLSQGLLLGMDAQQRPHYVPLPPQHAFFQGDEKGTASTMFGVQRLHAQPLLKTTECVLHLSTQPNARREALYQDACQQTQQPFYALNAWDDQAMEKVFLTGGAIHWVIEAEAFATMVARLHAWLHPLATSDKTITILLDAPDAPWPDTAVALLSESRHCHTHLVFTECVTDDLNDISQPTLSALQENIALRVRFQA